MRQFEHDAYAMMTRFLDPQQELVVVDVGANVGDTAARVLQEFPLAKVFALEPVGEVHERLAQRFAGDSRVRALRMGAGERSGELTFHVTRNRWCSSALPPSAIGKSYYAEWYDVERTEAAPVVRLDEWAASEKIARIDVLKVDVQGLELPVLRGAEGLLRHGGVKAVNCEAQLVAEYEGASTFSDIDLFLRSCGFALHQVHELQVKGEEQQSSYLDALWLRTDVLEALRKSPRRTYEPVCVLRMRAALERCEKHARTPIAIYGAGRHTDKVRSVVENNPHVVAVIDDDPARAGTTVAGKPVMGSRDALALGVRSVVLSSDGHEPALWERAKLFRNEGIPVVALYQNFPTDVALEGQGSDFLSASYRALTSARLAHLESLRLPLEQLSVLEVGAGVGEFTEWFVRGGCRVLATDGRAANVEHLRSRFEGVRGVRCARLDLNRPSDLAGVAFDAVFCYGLLYHLARPDEAIAWMSSQTRDLLLLETCVSFGEGDDLHPVQEHAWLESQALDGAGCRPTRRWVWNSLRKHFPHVYATRTQPDHPEFPLDWSAPGACGRKAAFSRAVFVAAHKPVHSSHLTDTLPAVHEAPRRTGAAA